MADLPLSSILGNPMALAAMSLILPVIILYLLRPKPKHVIFPSTMFIFVTEKQKRFSSFLQKFIRDPLLLLQVMIITVIVLSLANPFTTSMDVVRGKESIAIILDASASMQATDTTPTRFSNAIDSAQRIVSDMQRDDEVSIILAENIPVSVLSRGERQEARNVLGDLYASDTPSNVGDAILLARDLLSTSKSKKKIYVISDFADSDGLDPVLARKIAALRGVEVEFIRVGGRSDNVGIVSFSARRSVVDEDRLFATASVRNYGARKSVKIDILSGDKVLNSSEKLIESGSEEFFTFSPEIKWDEQVITARIDGKDYLAVDDRAYSYVPSVRVIKILLITGEADTDKYLRLMLQSLRNIELSVNIPPQPLRDFSNFDIIILGNAESDNILPGTFIDMKPSLSRGSDLIVLATGNLWTLTNQNLWNMMPAGISDWGPPEAEVHVLEEHEILDDVVFDNLVANKYFKIQLDDESAARILGTGGDNPTTLFAYRMMGEGHVVFMGLNPDPEWTNMYYSSSFPIFWSQLIKYLTRDVYSESMQDYVSGVYLPLTESTEVRTPSGMTVNTKNIFLDKTGVYEVNHPSKKSKITVSLLNTRESNITSGEVEKSINEDEFTTEREKIEVKHEYYRILLAVMLVVFMIEMLAYRWRGLL
ncbi:MAG: VWA domain-containing protein [Candidatus Altiarchaeota archaeon]